jgi:hypothetical protein
LNESVVKENKQRPHKVYQYKKVNWEK